ncbi:MAG: PA2779 family protein, partial [Desulfobacterales bacterium]|nr:PA2779 family protein [Desulfobacterales bacterium]
MQNLYRCRKYIGLTVLISTIFLYIAVSPSRAVMISTENAIHGVCDRESVKAFLERADVIAQMQAHGVNPAEARARVDLGQRGQVEGEPRQGAREGGAVPAYLQVEADQSGVRLLQHA